MLPKALTHGANVSRETWERLDSYVSLLKKWQSKTNLISTNTVDEIWERHIDDSLQLVSVMDLDQSIVDLASNLNFTNVFLVGEHFYKTNSTLKIFKDFNSLNRFIKNNPLKQQSILIKGSRGMRLERLLDIIE